MMYIVRNIRIFSIFFVFSIFICICVIGSNPAKAQFFYPPSPYNQLYGGLFGGSQGMPVSGFQFTPSNQFGQTWNTFGSNLGPNFGVIPVGGSYSGSAQTKEMAKGELIVHLSDEVQIEQHAEGPRTNMPEINTLLEQYGVYEIKESSSGEFYVLKFSKSHDVNDVRGAFEGVTEYVESAEANYIRKAHTTSSSLNTLMGMPGPMMGIPGPIMGMTDPMLGGGSPQVSSFPGQSLWGQGFSYTGTGLPFGSGMPTTQPPYSGFPFSQIYSGPGLTYGSSWQNQGFSFIQPSFNQWQQTSWGVPQSYPYFR